MVALLVPITFFMLERDLFAFDKNVILDKILIYKVSMPIILASTIALFFSKIPLLSVVACLAVVVITSVILIRSYKWLCAYEQTKYKKTYRQQKRLEYIESISPDENKIEIWALILNDEELLEKNQLGLMEAYINATSDTMDESGKYAKTQLLSLLNRNFNKIDFSNPSVYILLTEFALGYYKIEQDYRSQSKPSKKNIDQVLNVPPWEQQELVMNLMRRAINTERRHDILSHFFFSEVKKFSLRIDVDESRFIRNFLPDYIKESKTEDYCYGRNSLWLVLSDWKITSNAIKDKTTMKRQEALLNTYKAVIIDRTSSLDSNIAEVDAENIDRVTEAMLPSVNTILWFDIITFFNSAWYPKEGEDGLHAQIRCFAERDRKFGRYNSYSTVYFDGDRAKRHEAWEAEVKSQRDETIFILGFFYPWLRNPAEVEKVLEQITIIENENLFDKDEEGRHNLEKLKFDFENIREFAKEKIKEQKNSEKTAKKQKNNSKKR
jgi:hypothetical protein